MGEWVEYEYFDMLEKKTVVKDSIDFRGDNFDTVCQRVQQKLVDRGFISEVKSISEFKEVIT